MTDNGPPNPADVWPIPEFHFRVEWDGLIMSFQEVSGLDVESQPIEYRHGDSPVFSPVRMPGLRKFGNITLKRGVVKNDKAFRDWLNQIKMNTIRRAPVTITLLAESGAPAMTWTLANAWPTRITGTDLKEDGGEVAIEAVEIAHEGLTIAG